ncbi:MAG TPA: pitrilysin family protein [Dongiaceae bacterium]|nr:pitrilysin family protein [Dongiaceae bacterium]
MRTSFRPAAKVAGLYFWRLVFPGLVFSALLFAAPAQADIFEAEEFTLANGLQVVVLPNHLTPVVVQAVVYKAGAADGLPGKNGIAHFLEHLMFKGTQKLAPGQLSKEIDKRGGSDNAYTTQDVTIYHQEIAKEHLGLVMSMEADRMVNLQLTDPVVLPERDVILQERLERIDNEPGAKLGEAMSAAQFLNSPYRLPVIGWRHEMEQYTTQDALTFYKRFYAPDNAVLVVGGDVTASEVKTLAEKYFGPLPRHGIAPRERLQEPEPNAARRLTLSDERVRQPYLLRRYLAPSYRTNEASATPGNEPYALAVLAEILGGGSAGRLYRDMVIGKQTALSVGADYDGGAYDLDSFTFYGTPRQGGDMAALEAALDQQIAALLKDGVTDQEVADAKHRLEISAIKARDSVSGPTFIVAEALGKGRKLADVQAWPDRINEVTQADVMQAARQVLRVENSVTGILLPKPAQEASQ